MPEYVPGVKSLDSQGEAMADHILVVFSAPVAGRELEYEQWYDTQHLRDIVALPGFVAARRFDLAEQSMGRGGAPPTAHVAVYEIDGDLGTALDALRAARGTSTMEVSPAMDLERATIWAFTAK